ncbi:MAG: PAS domain-containing protein [Rhodoferax sp.]|nr:PAS domain-containing protein [Rhodoferax sp.]
MANARTPVYGLARRIQIQIGLIIAAITIAVTWLSFEQTVRSMREEMLDNLRTSTQVRAAFESQTFVDAQNNTVALRDEYLRRLKAMGEEDPKAEFDAWFVRYPDGLIRVRPERDDHRNLPSLYIRAQVTLTAELRRQVVVAFRLLREWGPAMTLRYYSAYIDLPGQSLIMYSPSVNWGKEAGPTTNNFDYPPVQDSAPYRNPMRKSLWTAVYFDDKAGIWMLSTITPMDQRRWIGTASQDIAVDDLIRRTTNEFAPGTYNLIMDRKGMLVAHPRLMESIQKSSGNLDARKLGDPFLADVFKEAVSVSGAVDVRLAPDGENYLGIARIRGPDWYFVTVYPKAQVESRGFASAKIILLGGALGLFIELILLSWIIRRQVALPMHLLNQAAQAVAQGDMLVQLHLPGRDELALLSQSFSHMTKKLRERDAALQERAIALEREVLERKRVEQSLTRSETFKDSLLNTIPDVIFVKDLHGRFIVANRAFEEKNGQRIKDIYGKSDFDFLPPALAHEFAERDREALEAGGPTLSEFRQMDHSNGESVVYETIKTPVYGADGALLGLLGVARDVTARKRAEDALQSLNLQLEDRVHQRTEQLEAINQKLTHTLALLQSTQSELIQGEKLASLGRMVAGLAHELNTPIGNALTIGTTLADHVREVKVAVDTNLLKKSDLVAFLNASMSGAEVLERALRHANELVSNFKQVSADQLSERRREFDLAVTVEEILSTLRPGFRGTPFQLESRAEPGIRMDSYPGLLTQVLSNLINNAKFHAFEGLGSGVIRVEVLDRGESVDIQVTDDGKGIPEHVRPRIFDPFFTTRAGSGGTGLGLSIVQTLVQQGLDGDIRVDYSLTRGTRFIVSLPKRSSVSD